MLFVVSKDDVWQLAEAVQGHHQIIQRANLAAISKIDPSSDLQFVALVAKLVLPYNFVGLVSKELELTLPAAMSFWTPY